VGVAYKGNGMIVRSGSVSGYNIKMFYIERRYSSLTYIVHADQVHGQFIDVQVGQLVDICGVEYAEH